MKELLLIILMFGLPGRLLAEHRIDRPNTDKGFVTVHYPEGFDPARRYDLLFWFHGTGGSPNPGIGRRHEGFVTVGMSYLKRDHVPAGDDGGAHWQECLAVRQELETQRVKLDRNLVAGMSKGGWMSFYIAAKAREGLHAVGIFAAGKDPNTKEVDNLEGQGLSVLVGTGETDPNFPQAQLAVKILKAAGATVFYEEWLGEGHTYHSDGRVRHWLDVESRRTQAEELRRFCDEAIDAELQRVEEWALAKDRYVALRRLVGDPRLAEASETLRVRVRDLGKALAGEPAVEEWRLGLAKLRALVGREAEFFNRRDFAVSKLDKLVAAYQKLLGEVGHPDLAARAAYGYRRATKMLAIYTAQMKARENPEYQALTKEYVQLQTKFGETGGTPGEDVMQRLQEVGARLGELRHAASMGAFHEAESGKAAGRDIPEVTAAIEAAAADSGRPQASGGLGF